jgi:hypothetical protein
MVPMKIKRWNSFSAANPSRNEGKLAYSNSTAKPLARLVRLSRSTQGCCSGFLATPSIRFAFGNGGDHSNYMIFSVGKRPVFCQIGSGI